MNKEYFWQPGCHLTRSFPHSESSEIGFICIFCVFFRFVQNDRQTFLSACGWNAAKKNRCYFLNTLFQKKQVDMRKKISRYF